MTHVNDSDMMAHDELAHLRQRVAELEAENARCRQMVDDLAQLRHAFDSAANPIIIADAGARILYVNRAFTTQTGYTAEEVIGRNPRLLQSGTITPDYYAAMWATLTAGRIWRGEFCNRKKDGTLYWEAAVIAPIQNDAGVITHYVAIKEDITDSKQALAAMQQSEANHRQIVELSPDAIVVHREGNILFVNAAAVALFGAEHAGQLIGHAVMDLVSPHSRERVRDRINRAVYGGRTEPLDQQILRLDGTPVDVSVMGAQIEFEGQLANLAIIRDVSARKEAERRLESERRFNAAVLDTVGVVIVVMDREGRITHFNRAAELVTGYTEVEMLGTYLWERLLLPEEVAGVRAVFDDINTTGIPSRYESYWIARDGSQHLIAWSNTVLRNADGEIEHVIGTGLDITVHIEIERQLREANHFLNKAQQIGRLGSWTWDVDRDQITLSPVAQEILDLRPASPGAPLTIADFIARVHSDDRAGVEAAIAHRLADTMSPPIETRVVHSDGTVRDVYIAGDATEQPDGGSRRIGIVQDITARKAAERELQERNQVLHRAQQIGNMGHWTWDMTTDTVIMSDTAIEIFGYLPGREGTSLTLQEIISHIHPDDLPHYLAVLQRARETSVSVPVEVRIVLPDGRLKDVLIIGETVTAAGGQPTRRIGIVQDITARKQAERELRENQQRLDLALRGADYALWDWDIVTGVVVRNDLWATILGYTPDEIEGAIGAWERLIHPHDLAATLAALEAHTRGETPYFEAEYRLRAKDGSWVWVQDRGRVVERDADGTPRRLAGMHHDITARKQAEQQLRQSEERHRAILQAIPDLIIRMNREGVYLDVLSGDSVRLVLPRDEMIGKSVHDVLSPQLAHQMLSRVRRTLDTGEMQQSEYTLEFDGKLRHFVGRSVVYGPDEVLTIVHDVTERKVAEQRAIELAIERERVQVLTNFVSDASHEFRTPLSVIGLNTYLLEKVPDREKHTRYLSEITGQIAHLVKLVDGLLIMARLDGQVAPQHRPIAVHQIASWVTSNYQEIAAAAGIELRYACAETLPQVWGDPELIMQAFSHVLDNALRYTPAGGTVTISAEQTDTHIVLSVTDTGPGLSPEEREHIFERFYRGDEARSTRGFGLGLPIAQAIVELHEGRIEVESTEGAGSTFHILLPLPDDNDSPA